MSGERGGHFLGPSLLIQGFEKVAFRKKRTSKSPCGGAELAETVSLAKILLIEVQHNAPACPDKQQQL